MKVILFETPEDQAAGLQYVDPIDPDTLYVFPNVPEGVEFHSRNVAEPFDIAFLTIDYRVLASFLMKPPTALVKALPRSAMAFEARAGNLGRWGILPGRVVSPLQL